MGRGSEGDPAARLADVRYLLDTCTVSELTLPDFNRKLRARFEMRRLQCCLASLVVTELRYGALIVPGERGRQLLQRTTELCKELEVLPFDEAAALWLADEMARLKALGKTPGIEDSIIAATAAVNGLTVVTVNTADFAEMNVPSENWKEAYR